MAMKINLGPTPGASGPQQKPRGRSRRLLGWAFNGRAIVGSSEVRENARFISAVFQDLRRGPDRRPAPVTVNGDYDVEAMAFDKRISVPEAQARMRREQAATRRSCFIYLLFGTALLAYWIYRALVAPVGLAATFYAVILLAIALWFFVLAFFKAYYNWQLRTGRPDPVRSFLATDESWWPR